MGMFDSIKVDYKLERPKELDGFDVDIQEIEYQTKDLESCLLYYTIRENGELWLKDEKFKWVDDDNAFLKGYLEVVSSEDRPANYHGILNFYCYEELGEKDGRFYFYSVDYEAKFSDNKLVDLKTLEYKVEDITERKQKSDKFWEKEQEKRNKFYNKYLFHTKSYIKLKRLIVKIFYKWHIFNQNLYMFVVRFL
jgi:hypothetical protein